MRPITLAPARLHGVVTLAVAALLVCMSFVAAPAAFAAAAAPVVDDQFERSVASGWGGDPGGPAMDDVVPGFHECFVGLG